MLLDTNALLWAVDAPHRLPPTIRGLLADRETDVFFSAASIWEIAIKSGLQKSSFSIDADAFFADAVDLGFVELPVSSIVAARVSGLPPLHRNPFDRLLVAQAIHASVELLTADRQLTRYSPLVQFFKAN